MIIEVYPNKSSMHPYILKQVLAMSHDASVYYQKFLTEARATQYVMLPNIHSFFNDKNQRIYTIQNKKGRDATVYAFLSFYVDDSLTYHSSKTTFIHSIWVKETCRRAGYASKLVRKMFEDRKGSEFQISVYDENINAQKFWKSLGFVNKLSSTYILNWEDSEDDND